MEMIEVRPSMSADGQEVVFALSARGREFECAVTRKALEEHFWLQRGAAEHRVLKIFEDGRRRITAVAERKLLTSGGERHADRIVLTPADFGMRR
jgi:hypothetical protein